MKNLKLFEEIENDQLETDTGGGRSTTKKSKTPVLDALGKDLTKLASENKLEPIHGREEEIQEVLLILGRKTKNNPVIIGEPGVGKTAIVEGIAQMISSKRGPRAIRDKRIVYIDMGSLIAGTSKQGDFEARIKALLDELEKNKNVLLFIDEIHMMVNPDMAIDAANMFKPALARGDMRLIGATTLNEYQKSIEKDGALERRFQKVIIDEPSQEETIAILNKIKSRYEDYHLVTYTTDAIEACVKLSGKYLTDRFFPDKAIDLMDEVGSRARLLAPDEEPEEITKLSEELEKVKKDLDRETKAQNYEVAIDLRKKEKELIDIIADKRSKLDIPRIEITKNDVAKIISKKIGVPAEKISQDEGEKLLKMEEDLKVQIIGQDEAVSKISKCIRRSRAGLRDPKKPAVFLFLGSTGTGKTHTVKTLAKYLFGSEDAMIRVDMSEYGEKHNVARLIGSPPGYVGYGEGGQLTEKVRRKPYCIILLDELEKAHPDVLNVLLQVFDDGQLTDGQGRKVNFKNTIIIMTSNIGSSAVKDMRAPVGFNASKISKNESIKDLIKKELKKRLAPEFINRIDDIIIFSQLQKENIYKIIDIEIAKLSKRVEDRGYTITITDNVRNLLIEKGYDEEMGARPLKRAIESLIEDPISEEILRNRIKDVIAVDYDPEGKHLIINGNIIKESLKFLKKMRLVVEKKFNRFNY